jgi:HEAT repeat protein
MESLLLTNAKDWAKVEKVLKEIASKSDDKQWKAATYANIALAQKHDAKAVAAVAALLSSPKENIRNAVLDAVGGRDSATESNWMNRGFGLVVDKSMLPALQKDYEAESKKDIKSKIVQAMAGIRAALLITAPTR